VALLRQCVFGVGLSYCDLNDHENPRMDPAFQTAVSRNQPLASASILCRYEQRADTRFAWAAHEVLVERFCASFETPPAALFAPLPAPRDSSDASGWTIEFGHAARLLGKARDDAADRMHPAVLPLARLHQMLQEIAARLEISHAADRT